MSKLTDLAERVEAGERQHALVVEVAAALNKQGMGYTSEAIRDGSLDAAKALHDAVLPGWDYCIACVDGEYDVSLGPQETFNTWGESKAPTPAAAWVAAILRAVDAKETNK